MHTTGRDQKSLKNGGVGYHLHFGDSETVYWSWIQIMYVHEKKLKHVETIKQLYCKVIKSHNFQSTMSFFLIKKVSCHEQEHEHHIPWPWKYCIHVEPCSYSFLHGNISTVTSNLSFVHNTKIFSQMRKESRTYLHLRNWIQIILAFMP